MAITNCTDIPFEADTPAEYEFDQSYFIYPKRGRPPMTEQFWYDPDEPEWGWLVWSGDELILSGVMVLE